MITCYFLQITEGFRFKRLKTWTICSSVNRDFFIGSPFSLKEENVTLHFRLRMAQFKGQRSLDRGRFFYLYHQIIIPLARDMDMGDGPFDNGLDEIVIEIDISPRLSKAIESCPCTSPYD
jgi:hypothetical protein